jgi:hypothetical protein
MWEKQGIGAQKTYCCFMNQKRQRITDICDTGWRIKVEYKESNHDLFLRFLCLSKEQLQLKSES